MDIFRTLVEIPVSRQKIDYQSVLLFAGSCFAENIGHKLVQVKFKTDVNPFGVLYNPISIKNSFEILLAKRHFIKDDLFLHNHLWHSFYHHSKFSHPDVQQCLATINQKMDQTSEMLVRSNFLFITWGTAWVYESVEGKHIVSNCHKLPPSNFTRRLLDLETILAEYHILFEKLSVCNPHLHIVLSVSPIRHWKDGAVNNQVSKATLLLAVSSLVEKYDFVSYFPAYEIVMDELRDYRFYNEDMLHLNNVAIEYIWKRFCDTYFEKHTLRIINQCEKIVKSIQHRPFHKKTQTFIDFHQNMLKKTQDMQKQYPYLDFEEEIKYFQDQLSQL